MDETPLAILREIIAVHKYFNQPSNMNVTVFESKFDLLREHAENEIKRREAEYGVILKREG